MKTKAKARYSRMGRKTRETIRRNPMNWALTCGIRMRGYQVEIASAISDSVLHRRGLTFVIVLPRQSGKNEIQAHLLSWLLFRAGPYGGKIVSVAPTFNPQAMNNLDRVVQYLNMSPGTRGRWKSSAGYMFRYGLARLQFLSAAQSARVVGATADLLLSVDEAQDVSISKFDKEFDPMTASTNATRAFWGTAWTTQTLLHRQMEIAKREQEAGRDPKAVLPHGGRHPKRAAEIRGEGGGGDRGDGKTTPDGEDAVLLRGDRRASGDVPRGQAGTDAGGQNETGGAGDGSTCMRSASMWRGWTRRC